MVAGKAGPGDLVRTPVELLGISRLAGHFADDAQVVQRVGKIGMQRTELRFLMRRSLAQISLGGGMIAPGRCLFGRLHECTRVSRCQQSSPGSL